jgi:hypothetical protein
VRDQFIHPVERPQESGLAATRGPDEGRDLSLFDLEVDILQGLKRPVKEIQILGFHFYPVIRIPHKE